MERITVSGPDGTYEIPEGKESAAARRLASFENAWERLTARQGEVTARMEALKAEGKQKTAQFREPGHGIQGVFQGLGAGAGRTLR